MDVSCNHIHKSFVGKKALNDITFQVEKGELFGVIGPDGAGKTTLFRILTSLMAQDEGTVTTAGFDVLTSYKKVRKRIGYMPGKFSLYSDLTVRENLEFFATIFDTDIDQNYHLIKEIYEHIKPFESRKAGDLSGGMKQKLALSCALIHKPEVLFLDEPTTGIDAISRMELWQLLKTLKSKNVTVLVSTPYMDEALLCDRIMMMQNGEILGIDTTEVIISQYDKKLYNIHSDNNYKLLKILRSLDDNYQVHSFGHSLHLSSKDLPEFSQLKLLLKDTGVGEIQIENILPTIEDCFMNLMVNPDIAHN